jgi:hypothetical protein
MMPSMETSVWLQMYVLRFYKALWFEELKVDEHLTLEQSICF